VEVLSEAEIERLLAVFDRNDPYGSRKKDIVFTMLDAGLRATELLDLTLTNARIREGFLKVLGKGDKAACPGRAAISGSLRAWLERFRPLFANADIAFLFLNAKGQRMTLRALEEIISRSGNQADIAGLHPHRLRHTFATRFLTEGLGDNVSTSAAPRPHQPGDGQAVRFNCVRLKARASSRRSSPIISSAMAPVRYCSRTRPSGWRSCAR